MVKSLGQVMLYVRDLDANAKFWKEQAGFQKVEKVTTPDGDYIYVVAPLVMSEVQLVLQDKSKVEMLHPELHLGTPSIMMQTDNLEHVYNYFVERGVHANPIMEYGELRFFNFSDNEGNYFAIQEV
ncbi:VOC family protein [Aerococcaceae bacterium NML201209]|nr:VOC family protein [Aerococcaceae bacterium NML201209]MCW6663400.1 VOC family protein [Aerococcaceae bacterium NML190073]MCW6664717.1 VOC family protein [Aerococcaceae bacterium NML191219]